VADQEKDHHHFHNSFIKNKFKVNTKIRYPLPVSWNRKVNVDDVTTLKIYADEKRSFIARNFNVFSNYVLSFTNTATIEKWRSSCDFIDKGKHVMKVHLMSLNNVSVFFTPGIIAGIATPDICLHSHGNNC